MSASQYHRTTQKFVFELEFIYLFEFLYFHSRGHDYPHPDSRTKTYIRNPEMLIINISTKTLSKIERDRDKAPLLRQLFRRLFLLTLTICLGGIIALVNDEILRLVVLAAGEVRLENSLGTSSVALLRIDGGTGHVGNHGIASAPWVGGVAERMVLGGGLREPDVTTVAAEVAGLEGIGDVFLDDDGATGSVDEP